MADIIETRRVVIEYGVNGPAWQKAPTTEVTPELVEAVRRELIKTGFRNLDIFGGKA